MRSTALKRPGHCTRYFHVGYRRSFTGSLPETENKTPTEL